MPCEIHSGKAFFIFARGTKRNGILPVVCACDIIGASQIETNYDFMELNFQIDDLLVNDSEEIRLFTENWKQS